MNIYPGVMLLVALVALCLLGLWHVKFNDNIGQCIGMVLVVFWALSTISKAFALRYVASDEIVLCVGLLCYGTGSGVRTWLYKRERVSKCSPRQ